ncbi:DNA-processing protein DprA [Nocardia sp. NPDC050710]|uniref:DNA-processing protein DprA n=1 Tax=Nocardia sp. NPDC050710 TaxID=3157220 RepID=UPI0033F85386
MTPPTTTTDRRTPHPDTDPRRLAWALLSLAADGPSNPLWHLIATYGVTAAAAAVAEKLATGIDRRVLARAKPGQIARLVSAHYAADSRLLTPDDPEWPTDLLPPRPAAADTDFVAPLALWVRGQPSLREIAARSVAVVGVLQRHDHDTVIDETVEHLVRQSRVVATTGAFGTAARAIEATLHHRAATLTVAAVGTDLPHPHQHRALFERQHDAGGLLVSPYPPGTAIAGHRGIYRDQLLAALCGATVVITAGRRGSAYRTAHWAHQLQRRVHAFPGPDTDPAYTGANRLLLERTATPLSRPADIPVPEIEPEPSTAVYTATRK